MTDTQAAEENYILARLVEFFEPEVELNRLDRHYDYLQFAKHSLAEAAEWYAKHKLQKETNWDELDRIHREEEKRKLDAWRAEKLEGVMTGVLAGMMPKLGRAGLDVEFDVDENVVCFTARVRVGDDEAWDSEGETAIVMSFDKEDRMLFTRIETAEYRDDVSKLNGNTAPRDKLAGLEAVHLWLDAREAAREAAERV